MTDMLEQIKRAAMRAEELADQEKTQQEGVLGVCLDCRWAQAGWHDGPHCLNPIGQLGGWDPAVGRGKRVLKAYQARAAYGFCKPVGAFFEAQSRWQHFRLIAGTISAVTLMFAAAVALGFFLPAHP